MAFANTLSTSWQIFKTSAKVLSSRKELAVFPLLSGITSLLVLVGMVALGVLLLPATTGERAIRFHRSFTPFSPSVTSS